VAAGIDDSPGQPQKTKPVPGVGWELTALGAVLGNWYKFPKWGWTGTIALGPPFPVVVQPAEVEASVMRHSGHSLGEQFMETLGSHPHQRVEILAGAAGHLTGSGEPQDGSAGRRHPTRCAEGPVWHKSSSAKAPSQDTHLPVTDHTWGANQPFSAGATSSSQDRRTFWALLCLSMGPTLAFCTV
jgi:hypothetical protein